MKQTLVRTFVSIAKLSQGFEVELAIYSPLAYLGLRLLAALCYSTRRLRLPRGPGVAATTVAPSDTPPPGG